MLAFLFALLAFADYGEIHAVTVDSALPRLHGNARSLLEIGRNSFGLKYLRLPGPEPAPGEVEKLKLADVAAQLNDRLGPESWDEVVTLKKNEAFLKRVFHNFRRAEPWVRYELGDRAEAKAILEREYAREARSMLAIGSGSVPFYEADFLLAGLRKVSSPAEVIKHEETMRKLKAHASRVWPEEIPNG